MLTETFLRDLIHPPTHLADELVLHLLQGPSQVHDLDVGRLQLVLGSL